VKNAQIFSLAFKAKKKYFKYTQSFYLSVCDDKLSIIFYRNL